MPLHSTDGPVKIYSPGSPGKPWRVTWSPPGMIRQVKDRQDEKSALALAQEIKGQLKRGEIGRIHRVTKEEHRLLEICRKLRNPEDILKDALDLRLAALAEQLARDDRLLTVAEAAEWLGCGRRTLDQLVSDRRIPAHLIGGRYRFDKTEILKETKLRP